MYRPTVGDRGTVTEVWMTCPKLLTQRRPIPTSLPRVHQAQSPPHSTDSISLWSQPFALSCVMKNCAKSVTIETYHSCWLRFTHLKPVSKNSEFRKNTCNRLRTVSIGSDGNFETTKVAKIVLLDKFPRLQIYKNAFAGAPDRAMGAHSDHRLHSWIWGPLCGGTGRGGQKKGPKNRKEKKGRRGTYSP